jgi:hypothetical protein
MMVGIAYGMPFELEQLGLITIVNNTQYYKTMISKMGKKDAPTGSEIRR